MLTSGRRVAVLALSLALLAGCGGAEGGAPQASGGTPTPAPAGTVDQLYAQAKREGTVVFDAPPPADYIAPVLKAFQEKYPGISVKYQSIGDQQIIPVITAQEAAGSVQIDLASDAMDYFPALLSYMAPVSWSGYGVPQAQIFQNNLAVHWFDTAWSVAYNTSRVQPQDVPQTWNDLLKPRFAGGRVALDNAPSYADGLMLDKGWGRDKAIAYARQLAAQKPLIEARPILVLQAIVSGQADVGTTGAYLVLKAKSQGQPIDIAPVSPQTAPPVEVFLLKGAQHTAAATLLGSWLVSAEGRQAFEKASYFGMASPCGASSMAAYLCGKHVTSVWFPDYGAVAQEGPFMKDFNAALGVSS